MNIEEFVKRLNREVAADWEHDNVPAPATLIKLLERRATLIKLLERQGRSRSYIRGYLNASDRFGSYKPPLKKGKQNEQTRST